MHLIGLNNVEENNNARDAVDGRILINNNAHRIIAPRQEINRFFQGGLGYETDLNKVIHSESYQLGWDSFIALRHENGRLKIEHIDQFQNEINGFADITGDYRNLLCECVVTRAVDSCTFIYVRNGDKYYMFHLDECDDVRADFLRRKLHEIGGGNALISLIKGQEGYINCFSGTGMLTEVIIRTIGNYETLSENDKKSFRDCPDAIDIYGHFEIGLHSTIGEVALFGDVTDRWRGDYEVPYHRFYSRMELRQAIDSLQRDLH